MKEKIQRFLENKTRLAYILGLGPVLISLVIGCIGGIARPRDILYICVLCMCLTYPAELLIVNIVALVRTIKYPEKLLPGSPEAKLFGVMDLVTVIAGTLLSVFYGSLITTLGVQWDAVWDKQLYNKEIHQPVWTEALPMVFVLLAIGVIGYIVLLLRKMSDTPPLITVLCIGAMYVGIIQMILFMIQIFKITPFEGLIGSSDYFPVVEFVPLMELPFCCISMAARLIIRKIYEWNIDEEHKDGVYEGKGFIGELNEILNNSLTWPVAALIAMLPILAFILGIMSLFGQYPDQAIRAWTETAQWNLSKMKAPPNVEMDEHYLCTVAAGGHEKIVKPIRMGERHGHKIVVNRQLLIANAFEQVLEEKTPLMHRAIRNFYDKHGYPVARHIRTKSAADVVYYIMKPLEWIFLIVLYMTDPHPENRIATQYIPKQEESIWQTM